MTEKDMGALGRQIFHVAIVCCCLFGLLVGCSSQLRTTTLSGGGATKKPEMQATQIEPEHVEVQDVFVQPVEEKTPAVATIDIPVEEPPKPAPRRERPTEIFSTTKSADASSEGIFSPEDQTGEPLVESSSAGSDSSMQGRMSGIPPISFEPEMPALPGVSYEDTSTSQNVPQDSFSSTPDSVTEKDPIQANKVIPQDLEQVEVIPDPAADEEPIQVAKVVPQDPEQVEITTETLEAVLSDVYFDYDRFAIRDDAMQMLKQNAKLLALEFPEADIIIEGHCDERGTQSYNLVLGEARASAVKAFLEDLGIPGDKLQVVSYGKEKPFCREQTEECWQENRRGHFVIK